MKNCPKCGAHLEIENSVGIALYVCENVRKRKKSDSQEPLCDFMIPVNDNGETAEPV